MDYWEHVDLVRHINFQDFREAMGGRRVWAFTTKADLTIWDAPFGADDALLFGPESRGLPDSLLAAPLTNPVRIPMSPSTRSLNLATAAGVGLYEALRRTGWRER